MFTIWKFFPAV